MLEGVFDYAGLFPPTSLDLPAAAEHYFRYVSGPESWITNRFVCPVGRLNELLPLLPDGDPWGIACLGSALSDHKADLQVIEEFEDRAQGRAVVECYEVKAGDSPERSLLISLSNVGFEECFVELPWGESMLDGLHTIADCETLGAKARTGSIDPSGYPSCEELAMFLQECLNLDLPMKFTAGLHHPFRFYDESVGTLSHGFLNVICAGVLAEDHDLSRSEIAEVLSDENPGSFRFSDDCFVWKGMESEIESIDDFRELMASIGSCSIEDPLVDLREFGLGDSAVVR